MKEIDSIKNGIVKFDDMLNDYLLDRHAAAEAIGCHPNTLYGKGAMELKPLNKRIGYRVFYVWSDIKAFAAKRA